MTKQFLMLLIILTPLFLSGQIDSVALDLKKRDIKRAKILFNEGMTLIRESKLEPAFEKMDSARLLFAANTGMNTLEMIRCLSELGAIYYDRRNYEQARATWKQALNIGIDVLGESHYGVGYIYDNLGSVDALQGKYVSAAKYFEKALHVWLDLYGGDMKPDVFLAYTNLASIYAKQDQYEKAILYIEKSINRSLEFYGETHYSVAEAYMVLGEIYKSRKRFTEAKEYINKSIDILLKVYKDPHPRLANAYYQLGGLCFSLKQYDKAVDNFQKSLEVTTLALGDLHPDIAADYAAMGSVANAKEEYPQAKEYYEKAIDISKKAFGDFDPNTGFNYYLLAKNFEDQKIYNQANEYYKKALHSFNYTNDHDLSKVNSISDLVEVLRSVGHLYHLEYLNTKDKSKLYLANEYLQEAITALDYQSQRIGAHTTTELAGKTFAVHNEIIYGHYQLGRMTDSIHYLETAFDLSERTKSQLLYQAMQESTALTFAGLPAELLEEEYNLRTDIAFYETAREEKMTSGIQLSDPVVSSISGKLFDLHEKYDKLKMEFEKTHPNYYDLKYDLETIKIKEVQRDLLTTKQSLVEFFVGENSIYTFVINKDEYEVYETKKDFPLEKWISTFRKANNKDHFEMMIGKYCESSYALYQKLIAPIKSVLKEEVIIIPNGVLGYLPFEALLVEPVTKPNRWKSHHYWLKDKQISYCYSATLLRQMQQKKHLEKPQKSLLAFAPYYNSDTTLLAGLFRYGDTDDKSPLNPLPHSGEEIYGIQKIISGDVYYHEDATEDNFIKNAADYRILHLATHGKANDKKGMYSYLAFTGIKDSIENELLYMKDLYNLQLNADMVVLSACETGIGELQKGEGVISLARGFTYAGAKSIITSLWSVEDLATKNLMFSFYENLKQGQTKDAALRKAKLSYIQLLDKTNSSLAHPFYWSSFIGIGDMSAMDFK